MTQHSRMALGLALALMACSGDKPPAPKQQLLETPAFQAMLRDRDGASQIEKVIVELGSCEDARYVVTLKTSGVRRVVRAAFPGTLASEIYDAGVPYAVKADRPRDAGQREVDAAAFRRSLGDPSEAAAIASIRAEPFAGCAASYVVTPRAGSGTRIVHAEFPGAIVPAIQAAGIPYSAATR